MSAAPQPESLQNPGVRAAQHFREARAAYTRGEPARAAELFDQAAREVPHSASFFNAALAWEEAGERARAADDYDVALDLGQLSPQQEKEARLRLTTLSKLLGTLLIAEPRGATVQVEHLDRASVPLSVHLIPGSHRVVITGSEGERTERVVSIRAGEVQTLAFEPPLIAQPDLNPRQAPAAPVASLSPQRIAAWSTLGVAVAASATAIGLGVGALNARAAYLQTGSTSSVEYNRAASFRTWTNVSWGVAGLLGGAGLALLFIPPRTQTGPVKLAYGLGFSGMSLQGQF